MSRGSTPSTSWLYDSSNSTAMKRRRYCAPHVDPPTRRAAVCCLLLALGAPGAAAAVVEPFTLTAGSGLKWVKAADTREGHAAACLRNGLDPTPSEVVLSDQVCTSRPERVFCGGSGCFFVPLRGRARGSRGGFVNRRRMSTAATASFVLSRALCVTQRDGPAQALIMYFKAKFRCRKLMIFRVCRHQTRARPTSPWLFTRRRGTTVPATAAPMHEA